MQKTIRFYQVFFPSVKTYDVQPSFVQRMLYETTQLIFEIIRWFCFLLSIRLNAIAKLKEKLEIIKIWFQWRLDNSNQLQVNS